MLTNYVKITFRNLIRNKVYSAVNIGGLAIGMAVTILIGLWLHDELTFNRAFPKHARLAQVMATQTVNGETNTADAIPIPLADALRINHGDALKRVALVFPPSRTSCPLARNRFRSPASGRRLTCPICSTSLCCVAGAMR